MSARGQEKAGGWGLVQAAATAAVLVDLAGLAGSLPGMDPQWRAAVGLGMGGYTGVRALIAYGVWRRARWAAWAGGVLASLILFLILGGGTLLVALGNQVTLRPVAAALALAQLAASAAFLAGLVRIRRERTRRP